LELLEGDALGVIDQAFNIEEVLVDIKLGDTAVVPDKVIFVGCDFGLVLSVRDAFLSPRGVDLRLRP